jgi:predicted transcriptional regulator
MRRRGKKQKLPPGKFASIPIAVLKTAMAALTATELRVWLALCAQSQPWANGTAKLCRSVVSEFHLGSFTTVAAATKKLIAAGLIKRTRNSRPRHCALYGVTHLNLYSEAMAKQNATETAELATDSCSNTLATAVVASTTSGCSELPRKHPDLLQRM